MHGDNKFYQRNYFYQRNNFDQIVYKLIGLKQPKTFYVLDDNV